MLTAYPRLLATLTSGTHLSVSSLTSVVAEVDSATEEIHRRHVFMSCHAPHATLPHKSRALHRAASIPSLGATAKLSNHHAELVTLAAMLVVRPAKPRVASVPSPTA